MATEYELERMVVRLTGDARLYKQMMKESVAETKMAMGQIETLLTDSEARWETYRENVGRTLHELDIARGVTDKFSSTQNQFNEVLRQSQIELVAVRGGIGDMTDEMDHLATVTSMMATKQGAEIEALLEARTAAQAYARASRELSQEQDKNLIVLSAISDQFFRMPGFVDKAKQSVEGFFDGIKLKIQGVKNSATRGFINFLDMGARGLDKSKGSNLDKGIVELWEEEANLQKKTADMEAKRERTKEMTSAIGDETFAAEKANEDFGKSDTQLRVEQFKQKFDESGYREAWGDAAADEQVDKFEKNTKELANKQAMKQLTDEQAQLETQLVDNASELTDLEFQRAQAMQQMTLTLAENKDLTDEQRAQAVQDRKDLLEKLTLQEKGREFAAAEKAVMEERGQIGKTDLELASMKVDKLAEEGKISADRAQTLKEELRINEELTKEAAEREAAEAKQKQVKEEIKAIDDGMKKNVAQSGMTDEQKQLDDYKRLLAENVELTKAEREERVKAMEAQIKQVTAAEKQKTQQKEITELIKELDKANLTFGMEGGDLAAYEAGLKGANREQQEAIRSKTDMQEALGAEKELTEEMMEPMEKYRDRVKDLDKWHKVLGTRFDATYNKAMKEANKQLRADQKAKVDEEAGQYLANGQVNKFDDEYYAIIENTRKMRDIPDMLKDTTEPVGANGAGGLAGDGSWEPGGGGRRQLPAAGGPGGADGGLMAGIPIWERMATSLEELVKKPTLEVSEIGLV